jgi:hypothetical protein
MLDIISIVTFPKIKEFVNLVFYQKVIKQNVQESMNASYVGQEAFSIYQWINLIMPIFFVC